MMTKVNRCLLRQVDRFKYKCLGKGENCKNCYIGTNNMYIQIMYK